MGRGRAVCLTYAALVLLSVLSPTSAINIWTINIDETPAPPPALGPPFSVHASRNPALIPFQVIGVVGAYIGSLLILGALLLTVGRKLRKRAQTMQEQPKEMIKPLQATFDNSPVSVQNNRGWYLPGRLREKKSGASSIGSGTSIGMSPGVDSVASFDANVVESDRARRQEEMERLYAAVMAQDEERSTGQQNASATEPEILPSASPPEYTSKNPPRLVTDGLNLKQQYMQGPGTPKSPVRAIYPPGSMLPPGLTSPTSPIKAEYPTYHQRSESDLKRTREPRSPSAWSGKTAASSSSGTNKLRKSLRNIKISGPIPQHIDDNSDGARTPLSPRTYTDPGIPPDPPTARSESSQQYTPSWRAHEDEYMDEVRDLPQPYPQRAAAYQYDNQPQAITNTASTRPDPTRPTAGSAAAGALPLREMNRQYASQQTAQAAFPLSPGTWNSSHTPYGYATSAGPVKTTFLEPRQDKFSGPRTGAATPYSPYMPFTPVTPVTPHLTSRAERKQRRKEEKATKGVITEEDAVADERELWGSGY